MGERGGAPCPLVLHFVVGQTDLVSVKRAASKRHTTSVVHESASPTAGTAAAPAAKRSRTMGGCCSKKEDRYLVNDQARAGCGRRQPSLGCLS